MVSKDENFQSQKIIAFVLTIITLELAPSETKRTSLKTPLIIFIIPFGEY